MNDILIQGNKLHYRLDGPADAPVLLLSHSLGINLEMWAPQMPAFAGRFRVLRYDARGHGASAVPPGPYSIEAMGGDALGLLDALGIARVDFCGLSMGGMVGQWLGANAPDRLRRLVLSNTAAYMGPPESWDARIATVRTEGMAGLIEAITERWFTPEFRASDGTAVDRIRTLLRPTDPAGYAAACAAIRDMDQRALIKTIGIPTLVIGGTRDPATPPACSTELVEAIAGARLVMLEASHLSNVEQPAAYTEAVLDFLA